MGGQLWINSADLVLSSFVSCAPAEEPAPYTRSYGSEFGGDVSGNDI